MAQLADIQTTQKMLEESFTMRMAELEAQLQTGGSTKDTVARVAEEFRTFRELMFNMLRLLRQQITECSRMVDIMETRHRRKALIFLGVAETEKEDCSTVLLNIINKSMSIKDISASSIRVCHRIGKLGNEHHRPILVRFTGVDHKSAVWRAKSKFKGSPISVKEFLSKARQTIFTKARQHFGMRSCWTQDGIIIVKAADGTRMKIITMDELNSFMAKYPMPVDSSLSGSKFAGTSSSNSKSRKN